MSQNHFGKTHHSRDDIAMSQFGNTLFILHDLSNNHAFPWCSSSHADCSLKASQIMPGSTVATIIPFSFWSNAEKKHRVHVFQAVIGANVFETQLNNAEIHGIQH